MITALTLYMAIKITITADYTWLAEVKPVVRIEATNAKVVR